ncbi:TRAF-like family protein [Citrus sinensis]|uniref:TRAF-like family protein n=1 Tax=Citrus sinensis TaxID=2711 RepID=A0ACB8KGG7_CITSI|nr:TRAF-like family protein [Citrus sinensis]
METIKWLYQITSSLISFKKKLINFAYFVVLLNSIARYTSLPPAHFIVKIKSLSLLAEKAEEEYESGEFEVGGYKWYIYIYIYILFLNNTSSFTLDWEVSAVFRLFLLDQNQENYCVVQAFNDASNGYLVEDTCVFEAEEDRATPMGTGPNAGDCLSLFLVFEDSTVRSTVKVYAKFTFRILDQWGWSRFVSLSKLNDPENGYLVNDVRVVEAEITVLRISEAL